MVLLESHRLPLLTKMPLFSLSDSLGKAYNAQDLVDKNGLVILFTCNHCPYALAIWPRFIAFYKKAQQLNIGVVAINPNIHPDYPEDSVVRMQEKIKQWDIPFPYLVDEDQSVARQFSAQCTPDLYYVNPEFDLIYHGRFDDCWKDENLVSQYDLEKACHLYVGQNELLSPQYPSLGCSIKWL